MTTRAKSKPDETAGKVLITLAHPLTAEQAQRLALPAEPCKVGDEVWLWPATARAVIGAGYAQIDPEDKAAVAKALTPEQVLSPEERAAAENALVAATPSTPA